MFRLQLGIVTDFADTSGSKTTIELRPTLSLVPPILPIYGRVMVIISDVLGRYEGDREYPFGAAVGARIGIPGVSIIPSMGIFAELGALPRSRKFVNSAGTGTDSKLAWVLEARAGAYWASRAARRRSVHHAGDPHGGIRVVLEFQQGLHRTVGPDLERREGLVVAEIDLLDQVDVVVQVARQAFE